MSKKTKSRKWERSGRTNRHHNLAQCRGGRWNQENIFVWDTEVHKAFHFIFGNMTLIEASEWLLYVDQQKKLDNELDLKRE